MYNSLQENYKRKVLSGEKEYKPLKRTPLKSNSSLRDSYARKVRNGEKKAYKPKYHTTNKANLHSVFTDNLYRCYITGTTTDVHLHHIFGASNKTNSETYGFLLPLSAKYHNMSDKGIHFDKEFDERIKKMCQEYWLTHYGTKEEFIKIFGKWVLK